MSVVVSVFLREVLSSTVTQEQQLRSLFQRHRNWSAGDDGGEPTLTLPGHKVSVGPSPPGGTRRF